MATTRKVSQYKDFFLLQKTNNQKQVNKDTFCSDFTLFCPNMKFSRLTAWQIILVHLSVCWLKILPSEKYHQPQFNVFLYLFCLTNVFRTEVLECINFVFSCYVLTTLFPCSGGYNQALQSLLAVPVSVGDTARGTLKCHKRRLKWTMDTIHNHTTCQQFTFIPRCFIQWLFCVQLTLSDSVFGTA